MNVTTPEINTCKKIFEFGQREVISFFTLVTNKGEHSNMRQATCLKDEAQGLVIIHVNILSMHKHV
jgi:hypothetical protein